MLTARHNVSANVGAHNYDLFVVSCEGGCSTTTAYDICSPYLVRLSKMSFICLHKVYASLSTPSGCLKYFPQARSHTPNRTYQDAL